MSHPLTPFLLFLVALEIVFKSAVNLVGHTIELGYWIYKKFLELPLALSLYYFFGTLTIFTFAIL